MLSIHARNIPFEVTSQAELHRYVSPAFSCGARCNDVPVLSAPSLGVAERDCAAPFAPGTAALVSAPAAFFGSNRITNGGSDNLTGVQDLAPGVGCDVYL